MFIKEIIDYDKFSNEADLVISDGKYEVLCYCFQIDKSKPDNKVDSICSLFAHDCMIARQAEFKVEKLSDYYSYHLQGEIIDVKELKIRIGELIIVLDSPLPKDLKNGDYVEFCVDRLDCIVK